MVSVACAYFPCIPCPEYTGEPYRILSQREHGIGLLAKPCKKKRSEHSTSDGGVETNAKVAKEWSRRIDHSLDYQSIYQTPADDRYHQHFEMASFQIIKDLENTANAGRVKTKDFGKNNQKRPVLGVINGNTKVSAQNEKLTKPQLFNKFEKPQNAKIQDNSQKAKQLDNPFQIFQDDNPARINVAEVKIENKARVLRDRKIAPVEKAGPSTVAFLPACVAAVHRAPVLPLPEPMSPDATLDGSLSMDVSLKQESSSPVKTDDAKAFCTETALKELDCLSLTERMYMCEEYRDDISLYLRNLQVTQRPRQNYMAKQPDITHSMRAVLVDWLVEVVEEYKLNNETLYLAVAYIDRFLSSMSVVRAKLQLVGTSAMFIASKYEEIYPPDVKDFVYITDDTYTKSQVLRMEHLILRVLRFDLATPTVINFLTDFTSNYPTPDNVKYLAMYLGELSLLEGDPYLRFLPSEIAAAALCVARATLLPDEDILPAPLQKVLDVHLSDIMQVIAALERTFRSAETNAQQATRDKYKSEKYLKVSSISPPNEDCSSLLSREFSPSSTH